MNKLIAFIEKGKPFFEKLSRNIYLRAIRDGFIARKAESKPFVPRNPVAKPPSIGSAANINKPTIAANSVDI